MIIHIFICLTKITSAILLLVQFDIRDSPVTKALINSLKFVKSINIKNILKELCSEHSLNAVFSFSEFRNPHMHRLNPVKLRKPLLLFPNDKTIIVQKFYMHRQFGFNVHPISSASNFNEALRLVKCFLLLFRHPPNFANMLDNVRSIKKRALNFRSMDNNKYIKQENIIYMV